MEEEACFINRFPSTPSPSLSCHPSELENLTYEQLGGSVSLGRFMTEFHSLSWEKWSSFSRNRYVQEAERYSRPGSVAQKKAYFEAHFKRMAALKAAALLDQANATPCATQTSIEQVGIHEPLLRDAVLLKSDSQMGVIAHQPRILREGEQRRLLVGNNAVDSIAVQDESSTITGVKDVDSAEEVVVSPDKLPNVEKSHGIIQPAVRSISSQIRKPPLQARSSNRTSNLNQDSSMKITKKNFTLSSCVPSVDTEGSHPSSSPVTVVVRIHPGKENFATPMDKHNGCKGDDPDKKQTPLRMSINRELNKLISPVIKKIAGSSKPFSRDCYSTPLKTPAKVQASEDIGPNPVSETPPISGKKRMLFRSSASGSKPVVPSWHLLSEGGVQPPSATTNKTSSPIIPTSFCMRTGEGEGRKKENLEPKFNAKATTQKFKEKAEAELTKLRESFCFKPEPASDLYAPPPTGATKGPVEKLYKKVKIPSRSTMKTNDCLPPRSVRPVPDGRGGKQKVRV